MTAASVTTGYSSSLTTFDQPKTPLEKSFTKYSTFDSSAIFDLYVRCRRCEDYLPLFKWVEHKRLHKLLDACEWKKSGRLPQDDEIIELRQKILRKHQSNEASKKLHFILDKINEGFDFLRSMHDEDDRMSRFMVAMPVTRDYVAEELSSCVACVSACGIVSTDPKTHTSYDPQPHSYPVFQDGLGGLDNLCFLSICDAFNGVASAKSTSQFLQKALIEINKENFPFRCSCAYNMFDHFDNYSSYKYFELHKKGKQYTRTAPVRLPHVCPGKNLVKRIYAQCSDKIDDAVLQHSLKRLGVSDSDSRGQQKTQYELLYEYLDHVLSYGIDESSQIRWSACSLATAVINSKTSVSWRDADAVTRFDTSAEPQHVADLYVSNVGNTAMFLIRGNQIIELTKDDSVLSRKQRRERLIQVAEFFSENTTDAVSESPAKKSTEERAIPTKRALGLHGDLDLKAKIRHNPHYSRTRIDQFCQFLVCASAGLLECLSNEKIRQIILNSTRDICIELLKQEHSKLAKAAELVKAETGKASEARPKSGSNSRAQSAHSELSFVTTSMTLFDANSPRELSDLTPEPTNEMLNWPASFGKVPDAEKVLNADSRSRSRASASSTPTPSTNSSDGKDGFRQYVTDPDSAERLRRSLARRLAEALYRAARLTGCRDALSVAVLLLPGAEVIIRDMSVKASEILAEEEAAARESAEARELARADQNSRSATTTTSSRTATVTSTLS